VSGGLCYNLLHFSWDGFTEIGNNDDMDKVSTPVREARLRKGLSQVFVAKEVGIDPARLSRIERGEPVGKKTATKLAKFFAGEGVTEMMVLFPERYV
jgi:putative transcriptional regulator